ncbi:hypothetical protein RA180_19995 [Aeromonas salmonicida]|uniref:hypothetical protein n=1 Tax=Aeromonas salmonicida TaxID=645 RepID=UPI0027965BF0|nr:hypothetical protein [Aeromonas salmonicida]MDQ1886279.1 hypothetical protein [Aeromonas salmonicida]
MSTLTKITVATATALSLWHGAANATFSIIGYDVSKDSKKISDIGVALASCVNFEQSGSPQDFNIAPYISRIIPEKGAVVAIANPGFVLDPDDYTIKSNPNLDNSILKLQEGMSAPKIIRWLEDNDHWKNGEMPWSGTLQDRQYIVLGNKSKNDKYSATFSGENVGSSFGSLAGVHKRDTNFIFDRGYAIAGNILQPGTLGYLEQGFYNGRLSKGLLSNLLSSLLYVSKKNKDGVEIGDSRCTPNTSSAFAYVTIQGDSSKKAYHRYYNLTANDTNTDPIGKLIKSLFISNFNGWPSNHLPTANLYLESENVSYIFWEEMGGRDQTYGVLNWDTQKFVSTENKVRDLAPSNSTGRVSAAVQNAYNPRYVNVFWDDNTYSDFNIQTKAFEHKYNVKERWDGWPNGRSVVAATSILGQKTMLFVWDDHSASFVQFSQGGKGMVQPKVPLEKIFPGFPTGRRLTDIVSIPDSKGLSYVSGDDATLLAFSFHDGSVEIYSLNESAFINEATLLSSNSDLSDFDVDEHSLRVSH